MSEAVTPWNVLSDAIHKKISSAREKSMAAKAQQQQTEYKAWDGILTNPNSTEEERNQALENMRKSVPKDTIPIVDAYHKTVEAVRRMRKGGKPQPIPGAPVGGQGGQQGGRPDINPFGQEMNKRVAAADPGDPKFKDPKFNREEGIYGSNTPNAAPQPPNAAGSPPGLPKTLSDIAARTPAATGKAEGEQEAAHQAVTLSAKRQAAEDTIKAIKAHGIDISKEVEAEILSQPTGAIPASVMAPKKGAGNAPPKAPKVNYGPGGQFRSLTIPEDKETDQPGAEYPSRALIPKSRTDLLQIWDASEAQSRKEQAAELDKESRKNAQMVEMLGKRFDDAIQLGDHKAAQKVYNDSKKAYQDAVDRSSTMDANLRDINKAKEGGKENQQAMLSMLANHVGMTSGSQPKMRMSKAQWDEAKDSVPLLQRIEAKFDKEGYLSGVVLTPEQMDQMVELAHEKVSQLQDHVDRIKNDPDYSEALSLGKKAVPPDMKAPGKSKGKGTGKSKEEEEDEKFLQGIK